MASTPKKFRKPAALERHDSVEILCDWWRFACVEDSREGWGYVRARLHGAAMFSDNVPQELELSFLRSVAHERSCMASNT